MTNENVKIAIALTAGLCVGGALGYVVAKRHLRAETEREITGVKDLYTRLRAEDAAQAREDWSAAPVDIESETADSDVTDPESLAAKAVELGYINADDAHTAARLARPPVVVYPNAGDEDFPPEDEIDQDLREEVEYVKNIRFVNPHGNPDPDDVTQWDRSPQFPYVITEMEYRIDRPEFEKISLNYYKGDDTLAEADGSFIPDQNGTAGDENLHNYFGLASGDPLVLHVRNERVGCDFEITLDEGAFSREVLGFGIEEAMVKESKKTIRKMRSE